MALGVSEELKIVVKAEVDKATKGLKQVQGAAGGIEKNIKSLGIAALKYLGPAFLAGAVLKAGKAAVMAAAGYEQLKVSLEVLLGSAAKAEKLFESLREFAVRTPLQLDQLARSATTLMSFGTASDKVVDTLKNLGNLAQGMPDKLNRLVLAYGKVQAKGKATLEELNMFTEAGVPLMAELAKQIGITREELFKYVTEGRIGFEEVNAAVISMTTGQGQFAGMLEKQAETLIGVMSTFKDARTDLQAAIGDRLLESTKNITVELTKWVTKIADSIRNATELGRLMSGGGEVLTLEEQFRLKQSTIAALESQPTKESRTAVTEIMRSGNTELIELLLLGGEERKAKLKEMKIELGILSEGLRYQSLATAAIKDGVALTQQEIDGALRLADIQADRARTEEAFAKTTQARLENVNKEIRFYESGNIKDKKVIAILLGLYSDRESYESQLPAAPGLYGTQGGIGSPLASQYGQGGAFSPYAPNGMTSAGPGFTPLWRMNQLPIPEGGGLTGKGKGDVDGVKKLGEVAPLLIQIKEAAKQAGIDLEAMWDTIAPTIADAGIDAFMQLGDAIGYSKDALGTFVSTLPAMAAELIKIVGLQIAAGAALKQNWGMVAVGLGLAFGGSVWGGYERRQSDERANGGGSSGGGAVVNVEIYGAADAHIEGVAIAAINKVRTGYK